MNIQIIRKQSVVPVTTNKTVTLLFNKSHLRTQYKKIPIVSMYDEEGMYLPVSLKLTQIQSKIPSTLLSRWINANCSEKLLTLKDRCNTVEHIKDGVNKGWWFTNLEDSVYGLHKLIVTEVVAGKDTNFKVVKIDDSIGMKSVEHILDLLGMSIKCDFLIGKERMDRIHLDLGGCVYVGS